ncbi:uncharacterized protein LOC130812043 isoform X2 [Amaranthus tricolor]|nr:uncharacterized protein LOC130812043 isoform X2 [Amaranthus tricolor]
MVTLSAVLFEKLENRLLSCLDESLMDQDVDQTVNHVDRKDSGEEVLLLLRCCILTVRLQSYAQVQIEQLHSVVDLLHQVSFQGISSAINGGYIRFNDPISPLSTCSSYTNAFSSGVCAKSSDLSLRLLQQMLEVYLDELFADRPFLERIAIYDSVYSTNQNQSSCSSIQIDSFLELIAAHFLLSNHGEDVLQNFTNSLIWTEKPTFSSPEVSLHVAISLINHPVVMSAPVLIRTHLISLAAEVIGINVDPEKMVLKVRFVNIYLSTFYDSVILYYEHLSKLMTGSCDPERIVQRSFESHYHTHSYDIVNFVLLDLDSAWKARIGCFFDKTTPNMANDAISYIKMNIYIVHESCRDGVFSFFSSLIAKLFSVANNKVPMRSFEEMTVQDICYLASILKVMSCSLLQATYRDLSCVVALLKRKCARSAYNSLAGLLSCFGKYNLHLPIDVQQFIDDALKPHLSTCEEFELMFIHFAGLLSLCIVSGLEILVRGCLFIMLALLSAMSLELGSLGFSRPSDALATDSFSNAVSPDTFFRSGACSIPTDSFDTYLKVCARRTSSHRLAYNFLRERRNLLRNQNTSTSSEMSDEETCNGEKFLRCYNADQEAIDDLADFIECKKWRDYSSRHLYLGRRQWSKRQESALRLHGAKMKVNSSSRRGNKKKQRKVHK